MATAAELLARNASSGDNTLIIDNDLRTIQIPSSITCLGVENDDDVLRLNFKMPRRIGNIDLSAFTVRINYLNAKAESDVYLVDDLAIVGDTLTFSWLVGPTATKYKGNTKFNVCMRLTDGEGYIQKEYNTTIATLPVLEGLECEESVVEYYSDILEQWRRQLFGTGDTVEANLLAKSEEEQQKIVDKGTEVLASIPEDYQTTYKLADNAYRTRASAIMSTAQDETIRINDSSNDLVRGLRAFGKTNQAITTGQQLFDHTSIQPNLYTTISEDGTITIDCDNTSGAENKYATFYTPASSSLYASTYYAFILEVMTTSAVGEAVHLASNYADENSQFVDTPSVTNLAVGTYIRHASTRASFENQDVAYMCRGFMIIPAGTKVKSVIRITVTANVDVEAENFVYEPYTGGSPSPSPYYPQEIIPIGIPGVTIYGKNLLEPKNNSTSGYNATVNPDGSVTVTGAANTTNPIYLTLSRCSEADPLRLSKDMKYYAWGESSNGLFIGTKTLDSNGTPAWATISTWNKHVGTDFTNLVQVYLESNGHAIGDTRLCGTYKFQLEVGNTFTGFDGYKELQYVGIRAHLMGIPVNQNGNYTDSNGQQWICDEIDFERGVLIRRIGVKTFTGAEAWLVGEQNQEAGYKGVFYTAMNDMIPESTAICTHYTQGNSVGLYGKTGQFDTYYSQLRINIDPFDNVETWTARLAEWNAAGAPLTLHYILKEPVESEIDQQALAEFKTLHTNYPVTTINNVAGATMEVEYNCDTETWVRDLVNDVVSAVTDQSTNVLVDDITGTMYMLRVSNGKLTMEEV